ncbi:MAG: SDR family oxidoreductase [Pseudomonadota bacterium]|nr:SDR family oxidoreductase [Pseudomonadota bacterium]
MGRLEGQHVVVVGGASGIGLAVARKCAGEGARLTLVGRTESRLREAAAEIGGARYQVADAATDGALGDAYAAAGVFDHLVTTVSASSTRLGVAVDMVDMPLGAAHDFFEGKFWGQYRSAREALGHVARTGSITFTSGVAARRSLPGHTILAAANAAIEACARQLANELAPLRVNTISPGLTATRTYDHYTPAEREAFFQRVTGNMPLGRAARPEEIADAYLFAITADYLTGAVIDIDGGFLVQ